MSSLIVRLSGPSAFSNRPVRSSRDVRARAVEPSSKASPQTSGSVSGGGVPPQGGMPLWCLPMLAAAAAAPIYGYSKCQTEIAAARKVYEADVKAGRIVPNRKA